MMARPAAEAVITTWEPEDDHTAAAMVREAAKALEVAINEAGKIGLKVTVDLVDVADVHRYAITRSQMVSVKVMRHL